MEMFWRDLRYALRSLARSPAFAIAAILAMAVAIGANTAVFSLFDAVVWNAIPVHDFGNLVLIHEYRTRRRGEIGVSPPDLFDWQKYANSFTGLAGSENEEFTRTGAGGAVRVNASAVTPNFLAVLGAKPLLGRAFTASEAQPGHNHVAVLSYRYWQSDFGGRDVVGKTIQLNHASYTIVGVMPRGIGSPGIDLWVPLALSPAQAANRADHSLVVLGRLRPGVSLAQGQAELVTIAARLAKAFPATNRNLSVRVRSLRAWINGDLAYDWGLMFVAAMGLVLLIACANVANLQLARGAARQKEIALRAALGASRERLAGQLLLESLVTSLIGAALGLPLAEAGIRVIEASLPTAVSEQIVGWSRISINGRVLVFTAAIAVLAGVVSGMLPAIAGSRPDLVGTLKESGRSSTPGRVRGWLQGALVVAQVALALVLLVATSLMVGGVQNLAGRQERYAPPNLLDFQVVLPDSNYNHAQRRAFYRQALAKLRAVPGVRSTALFTSFPLSNGRTRTLHFQVAGRAQESRERSFALPIAVSQSISPGFFSMLHIRLITGRAFTHADGSGTLPVAIVSRNLAERFWPGRSAIGRQIRWVNSGKHGPWLTIVGIVGNVLWSWTDRTSEYAIFQPYTQDPRGYSSFVVAGGHDADALVPEVRQAIASINPDLPLSGGAGGQIRSLRQDIRDATAGLGVVAELMSTLGLIAFALAAIGVYSLTAYSAAQRRHEIGVRMALGADARSVLGLMLRRSSVLLAIGVAVGLPLAYALARLLGGLIFGVGSTNVAAFAGAIAVLAAAALVAGYFPARRAAQVDPVETLRAE
jgi:putative ABC transport system permease protein